jgi:hypothetical protein
MKLVAVPGPSGPPVDPLRSAAQEYVSASERYLRAWESRFDGRRHSWRKTGFGLNFTVPLKLARDAYYERASASSDPLQRHVAALLDRRSFLGLSSNNGEAVRILRNWLRDEPRLETYPAGSWFAVTAPLVDFARAPATGSYTSTFSVESKLSLQRPSVLCVWVGTQVVSASASLVSRRKGQGGKVDAIWKESRIWVMLGKSRLEAGDLVNITVAAAKRITRSPTVRMASEASGIVSTSPS